MKVTNFTIPEYDWNKMEKAIIEDATEHEDCEGNRWFESKEEFDEWAGDMFWEFLIVALEALGGEIE